MNKIHVFGLVGALMTLGTTIVSAAPVSQRVDRLHDKAAHQDRRAARLDSLGHPYRADRLQAQAARENFRANHIAGRTARRDEFRSARADRRARFAASHGRFGRANALRARGARLDNRADNLGAH